MRIKKEAVWARALSTKFGSFKILIKDTNIDDSNGKVLINFDLTKGLRKSASSRSDSLFVERNLSDFQTIVLSDQYSVKKVHQFFGFDQGMIENVMVSVKITEIYSRQCTITLEANRVECKMSS